MMQDGLQIAGNRCDVTESFILSGLYRGVCLIGKQKKPNLFKVTVCVCVLSV